MSARLLIPVIVCTCALSARMPDLAWSDTGDSDQLPLNITVDSTLAGIVMEMLEVSPTFRRQCRSLGGAKHLGVRIRFEQDMHPHRARAVCRLARYQFGRIEAVVQLPSIADAPELIAHELEHVAEFIEGTKFNSLALLRRGGVTRTPEGHFETERAITAGQVVAEEVWRANGRVARRAAASGR